MIGENVIITMEPGTEITFAPDTGLVFTQGQGLIARGTETDPIILTGEVKTAGSWAGIIFDSSAEANYLEHAVIEYGGSLTANNDPEAAGVKLTSDSIPVILNMANVTVRYSGNWGIWLTDSAQLPVFENNIITENDAPASVSSFGAHYLDSESDYSGNDSDLVTVRSNIVESTLWSAINVPWLLTDTLIVSGDWELEPGCIIEMYEHASIYIAGDDSSMNAEGTAEAPILITGHEKTAGYWDSIVFDTTNNALNIFTHTTVEYGGDGDEQYDLGLIVAVSDSAGVSISVSDCVLRNSSSAGIFLGLYPSFNNNIETSNVFSDNAGGDLIIEE
ncbi:hypothetical protein KKF34_13395 [Myxococcota bacterium]|nr:hypothetical protein [Myxococcota bacterium]MBU1497864.1 hypothetical protein [Myxococcota bacterium]